MTSNYVHFIFPMYPFLPLPTNLVSEILLAEIQKFFPVDRHWLEGSEDEGGNSTYFGQTKKVRMKLLDASLSN